LFIGCTPVSNCFVSPAVETRDRYPESLQALDHRVSAFGAGYGIPEITKVCSSGSALSFKPAFAGGKTVYMDAEDTAHKLSSGWKSLGTWMVP
jgi:hypothetical protein